MKNDFKWVNFNSGIATLGTLLFLTNKEIHRCDLALLVSHFLFCPEMCVGNRISSNLNAYSPGASGQFPASPFLGSSVDITLV
jgi:hypothetical protein